MSLLRTLLRAAASGAAAPRQAVLTPQPGLVTPQGGPDGLDLHPGALRPVYDEIEEFRSLPVGEQLRLIEEALVAAPKAQVEALTEVLRYELDKPWLPLPGPQTMAFRSEADIMGYGGAAGSGKLQPKSAKVLAPTGWKCLGEVRVGDTLCAVDGSITKVIGVYPQGVQPVYRATFSDGTAKECGPYHNWYGWWTGKRRKVQNGHHASAPSKWTTDMIRERMERFAKNNRENRFAVPAISAPVTFNVPGCPRSWGYLRRAVDPYFLGLWLGDGHGNDTVIGLTSADEAILSYVENLFPGDVRRSEREGNAASQIGIRGKSLRFLQAQFSKSALGLVGTKAATKFIPFIYKHGSVDERWALLQGLMDTDGWAEDTGCYYVSISKLLCDDVADVARSLGAVASVSEKAEPRYTYLGEDRVGQKAYIVRIKMPDAGRLFRLERKIERAQKWAPQSMAKYVDTIEYVREEDSVCIEVQHPSSLYITDGFTITHNTDVLLGLAGMRQRRAFIFRREAVQLTSITDRCQEIYGNRGKYVSQPVRRYDMPEEGRTIIFAHCKEPDDWRSYAGQARDFIGLDEAAEFLQEQVWGLFAWGRTVAEGQRTRAVFATNPPRGAEGLWFIEMFKPWLDPSGVDRPGPGELRWAINVNNELEWLQPEFDDKGNAQPVIRNDDQYTPLSYTFIPGRLDDNPYLVKSGYRGKLQSLPEPLRSQLLYGNFKLGQQDDAWQVIPFDWIEQAMARWQPQVAQMTCIAVDVAQGGCFRPDTEILTDEGWKFFPELTGDEKVLTLNGDQSEWGPITQIHAYQHDGLLFEYESNQTSFSITANHQLVIRRDATNPASGYRIIRYDEAPKNFVLRGTGEWSGSNPETIVFESRKAMPHGGEHYRRWEFDYGDWAELVGWFVSEGCAFQEKREGARWRVNISQNVGVKYDRIAALLGRMGISWYAPSSRPALEFSINAVGRWLADECGTGAANKRIPRSIKESSPAALRRFLEAYQLGDGSKNANGCVHYGTTSRQLVDDLQEVQAKLGTTSQWRRGHAAGTQFVVGGRSVVRERDGYIVTQRQRAMDRWVSKKNVREVPYSGMVYCVSTPHRTIMVRRNGKCMWSGNSDLTTLSPRHGNWFAPLHVHKGIDTKDGPRVAALVIMAMRDRCRVVIDLGGGWGGSTFDHLKHLDMEVVGFIPQNTSNLRSREGLPFANLRAEGWWRFREALDPTYGEGIALPPDPELKVELAMPRWQMSRNSILIESKEDIRRRLKRSTDRADAVIMAHAMGTERAERTRRKGPLQTTALRGYERIKQRSVRR
jgi:hypothetical protein